MVGEHNEIDELDENGLRYIVEKAGLPIPSDEDIKIGGINVLKKLAMTIDRLRQFGVEPATAYSEYTKFIEKQKEQGLVTGMSKLDFASFVQACEATLMFKRYLDLKGNTPTLTDPAPYAVGAKHMLTAIGLYRTTDAETQKDYDRYRLFSPSLVQNIVAPFRILNTYRNILANSNLSLDVRGNSIINPKYHT